MPDRAMDIFTRFVLEPFRELEDRFTPFLSGFKGLENLLDIVGGRKE